MEYMTAAEAAEKWGVTIRQVQRLLAADRIPGAKKYGRSQLIPTGADKPGDPRFEKTTPQNSLQSDFAYIVSVINIHSPRDNPESVLDGISEKRLRLMTEAIFAHLRGDFKRAMECYVLCGENDAVKLYFSGIAISAAMSEGDYTFYTEVESFLKDIIEANISEEITAYAESSLSIAYLGAVAPNMVPEWLKTGDFSKLPPRVMPDTVFKRAVYLKCIGKYEALLDVARTSLAFIDSPREISLPGMYLRVFCAFACFATGRTEEAERWLLDVMDMALPHGFITPFAEYITQFGGLMEQCMKVKYPEYYDAVINQANLTLGNWISFHNHFTKDNIMSILSVRDAQIALLVARGVPYKEIADQFHISVGTLSNQVQIIYDTLLITKKPRRQELIKFIL